MTYLLWLYSLNEGQLGPNNLQTIALFSHMETRMTLEQIVYIGNRAYQSY